MKTNISLRRCALLPVLLLVLTGCGDLYTDATGQIFPENTETPSALEPLPIPIPTPSPSPTPFPEYDISLMMVGDNLMHMGIINSGKQENGSYDYSMLYEDIAPQLQAADIKIINQETILGGNDLGFSGYPNFNSPTEVGDAIAGAGFNVVLHASNHAADQRLQGLDHCAAFWHRQHPEVMMLGISGEEDLDENGGILPLSGSACAGANRTADWRTDERGIGYMTVKGVTFAVLNYTYGPNMETIPSSIMGHLNILCDYDRQSGRLDFTTLNPQVTEDIAAAQEQADVVIVCPHWGTEYATSPSSYQEQFALQMTEAGADLIIGTHPHVVQPVEWIEAENGNRSLCFYSLGNYISTQKKGICMLEAMAWVTFHVDEQGLSLAEEQSGPIPLVCQYSSGPVRFENVCLLQDYTQEQAARHGIRSYGGVILSLDDLLQWSSSIFGDKVPENGSFALGALHWPDCLGDNLSLTAVSQ